MHSLVASEGLVRLSPVLTAAQSLLHMVCRPGCSRGTPLRPRTNRHEHLRWPLVLSDAGTSGHGRLECKSGSQVEQARQSGQVMCSRWHTVGPLKLTYVPSFFQKVSINISVKGLNKQKVAAQAVATLCSLLLHCECLFSFVASLSRALPAWVALPARWSWLSASCT